MGTGGSVGRYSAVLLLVSLAAGGCGKKNNEAATASSAAPESAAAVTPESAAAAPAAAPTTAPPTDPQIAQIVLSANSGDSARGVLAQQKSTNADVKGFGRLMVVDHGRLNKETVALAKKLNVTPQPSAADSDLINKVQAMGQTLQGKSGMDFDSTYIDQEVAIHQLVQTDLDSTLIPDAKNPQLKKALQSARAVVVAHLKRAQEIQGKLK